MGNLPNSPVNTNSNDTVIYNDPNSVNNQNPQAQPGDSNVIQTFPLDAPLPIPQSPSGLEMPAVATIKNESLYSEPTGEPSIEKSPEKIPIPEGLKNKNTTAINPTPVQANTLVTESVAVPIKENVVNITEKITSLHHIQETNDNLTKKADDEEEKFITEVEKHHGHL